MNYGELISDAFRITWRNKFLWFFGFFVAGTSGGSFNVPSNFGGSGGGGGDFGDPSGFPENSLQSSLTLAQSGPFQALPENLILIAVLIGIAALLLFLVFIALSLISDGGLASSVAAIKGGEERRFGSTWRAGLSNIWRVLGLKIVLFLISLGLLVAILLLPGLAFLVVFLVTESTGWRIAVGVLGGLFALALMLAVFLPYWIIGKFALRSMVVGRDRVIGSIGEGYGLFRRNLGRSLLVGLILIGLSIGITIALLILLVILGIVLALPAIFLFVAEYSTAGIVAAIVAAVLFIIPLLILSGAVGTFYHSYWTLAYLRLIAPPPPPSPPNMEPTPSVG